ncbi:DUF4062 domain-containing protein [Aurantimonas coralicida]|nr:DUF4062 domain-containing protein [Aurantimonas coralicida]
MNESHSDHWGIQFKLVGWEATLPGFMRAQAVINKDLDRCEYFVGLMWNHWGSKPDDGSSSYTSGLKKSLSVQKRQLLQGECGTSSCFSKKFQKYR